MHIEVCGKIDTGFGDVDQLGCVETRLARLFTPLRELHALPLVREAAATPIVWICRVLKLRYKLKALLELRLEVR